VWAVLENLGYRQLTVWWRLRGVLSYLRGKKAWGKMTRTGFESANDIQGTRPVGPEAGVGLRTARPSALTPMVPPIRVVAVSEPVPAVSIRGS